MIEEGRLYRLIERRFMFTEEGDRRNRLGGAGFQLLCGSIIIALFIDDVYVSQNANDNKIKLLSSEGVVWTWRLSLDGFIEELT